MKKIVPKNLGVSRRNFIVGTAAAASGLAMAAGSAQNRESLSYDRDPGVWDGQKELELDVAIVGAGISGLYSGWRLRAGKFSSGPYVSQPPTTHVFELSDRVGGRLLTTFLEGMPHVRCELGGMRYILATPTRADPLPGHQMVHNLGKEVGLTSIEFPMGDGDGMYYLRRQRCWVSDIRAGVKLPYNLAAREQGKTDDDPFNEIVKDVLDKGGANIHRTGKNGIA